MLRIHAWGTTAEGWPLYAFETVSKKRRVTKRAKKAHKKFNSAQSKRMKVYWAKRRAEKAAQTSET